MSEFTSAGFGRAAAASPHDTAFAAVSSVLWYERELLERLLFKLTAEQLIVRSGVVRWLPSANEELQAALMALQESEVVRAIEVDDLVTRLGVSGDLTLREISVLAPPPWDELLRSHHSALAQMTAEIMSAAAETRRLLDAGAEAARKTLNSIGDNIAARSTTYTSNGTGSGLPHGPLLLDRQA